MAKKIRVQLHKQGGYDEVERGATVGATIGLNLYKADGTLFDLTSFAQQPVATPATLTLTTTGSSGAATYIDGVLNIPVYTGGGGGGATNLSYTASPTNGVVASDTGNDATLTLADGTNAGLMAPAQHTKLAGVASGATANSSDATLLNRANHTGTQPASTISNFDTQVLADMVTGKADRLTNQRAGAADFKAWSGTQAQYDALGSWDAGTEYIITDAPSGGGGGGVSDGDKGDIVVSGGGAVYTIDSGVVSTAKMGGDVTAAGKALLDDADATAQRATLGLGTAALAASSSFAATTHTHAIADVTGFSEAVDDRVAALVVAGSGISVTYNDVANTLTVAATGGGSDPWTYIKLGSDFVTGSASAVDITGMSFTPAANTDYEVEWLLLVSTATTTVGVRQGAAWGTGYQYGAIDMYTTSSATAETQQHVSMTTVAGTALAAVGGLPVVNRVYGMRAMSAFRSGATPTAFRLQLASETAATNVTAKAGSYLKYRTI